MAALDGKTALSAVGSRCLSADTAHALIQSASFPKTELTQALHNALVGPQDAKTCSAFVRYLVEAGADVNHQTSAGNTALILASMWGQTEAVRILLSKGADVTMRNKAGETAADVAKNREIRALITDRGR